MATTDLTQTMDLRRQLDAAHAENHDLAQMLGGALMALTHPADTEADRAQTLERRILALRADFRELAWAAHSYVRGSGMTAMNIRRLEAALDRPGVQRARELV